MPPNMSMMFTSHDWVPSSLAIVINSLIPNTISSGNTSRYITGELSSSRMAAIISAIYIAPVKMRLIKFTIGYLLIGCKCTKLS